MPRFWPDIDKSGFLSKLSSERLHHLRRNLRRVHDLQGLPIETLQSIQALDQARREYLRALVDYNTAQFRLQRALGWPVQLSNDVQKPQEPITD